MDVRAGLPGTIGRTPLIELKSLTELCGVRIFGKAEFLSPGGSVKDRAALRIITDAESSGKLKPAGTLVEGTGGNTGVALALIARSRGYKCIICMTRTISLEKRALLHTFGAQVVLTEPVPFTNPQHYYHVAASIASKTPGAFFCNQFENLSNYATHYEGTGPEMYVQSGREIDGFICAAGTGGTLAGVSLYLKGQDPRIKCFLMDPPTSHLYHYVRTGELRPLEGSDAGLEGIGIDRVTENFKKAKLDGALTGTAREAIEMAYYILKHEGLFLGTSACFNLVGACKLALLLKKSGAAPRAIATILCDSGDRYLSKIYSGEWLKENDLVPVARGLDFIQVDGNL
ncbi:hypothetical protein SmJEL517_g05832 [Synchytrium microbalum]|uniref:Tryptophan synthase beta chain-like PALP domain-containing protein n=1 Tax=Synchytrium microbalum TaxID=1806994 RepID=A0A507BJ30_9FUNG|nr:uncharacterized protein SmJEL517_g05832 [Synchytrium microbalum]TPX30650.1 hypothetical protein SmJEL517_g05832 [Synchytrium microbalum]